MIHDLRPYRGYKDSSVPWLGEIPAQWDVRKLKYTVTFSGGGTPSKANASFWNGHIPWVSPKDMRTVLISDAVDHITEEAVSESATNIVPPGAVLIVVRSGILRRSIPVAINTIAVALNQDMKALRPKGTLLAEYLRALVQGNESTLIVEWTKQGATVESIEYELLANSRIPIPPLSEQNQIVRFLLNADRRLRRHVRAKQKLIKLLEEQKQAIIQSVVTRGLDLDVHLKPSGVKWLGDVPEHWEIRPAKRFYREVDQRSVTGQEELLSVSHITGVTPRSQKNITMFMASSYVGHKLCMPGDLVINTMWAWMGALGVAKQAGLVSPSYGVYRPLRGAELTAEYADLLLRTRPYVSEYICHSTGITSSRLRLYPEQFLRVNLVCPPPKEQQAILDRVSTETATAQQAIAATQREISLLREYRSRLIGDVVTGKLDVRQAADQLPHVNDESEELPLAHEALEDGEEADLASEELAEEEVMS